MVVRTVQKGTYHLEGTSLISVYSYSSYLLNLKDTF